MDENQSQDQNWEGSEPSESSPPPEQAPEQNWQPEQPQEQAPPPPPVYPQPYQNYGPPPPGYAPQPTNYGPVPPPTTVQYVVQEQSLKGIGGWLLFFLIVFGIWVLSGIVMFFTGMAALTTGIQGTDAANAVVTMIFGLLIAGSSSVAITFIAMEKKIGVMLAWIALGVQAMYTTVTTIIQMFVTRPDYSDCYGGYYSIYSSCEPTMRGPDASTIIMLFALIFVAWAVSFLVGLYFKLSKRVKHNLVKL